MNKLDYLRKVFNRTSGKTLENYVINQIWAGVKDLGLYPVTQQYVNRGNGNYALLDLYFPQINFAIEVDEKMHEKNKKADKMRMDDIYSAIKGINSKRIKEVKLLEDLENQIQKIIKEISAKCRGKKLRWDEGWQDKEYKEFLKKFESTKKIEVKDSIHFATCYNVGNNLFKLTNKKGSYRRSLLQIKKNSNKWIWFFKKSIVNNNSKKQQEKYQNTITENLETITETYRTLAELKKASKTHTGKIIRYSFAKYKNSIGQDGYHFIGVFKFQKIKDKTVYYKRFDDKIDFTKL